MRTEGEGSTSPGPIFIAGQTASGKSALALELARRLDGEIISVDSMQVYRGLDIGTAKPSAAEQALVPHHLIDVVDLHETFDAATFCAMAAQAVSAIESRKRIPIFCGGTGLYFKAYLEGLGEAPPSDVALRAELERTPLDTLLRELEANDPVTFARIDQQNPRRVIRAMEVIRLTGKPFSEQRSSWQTRGAEKVLTPHFYALQRPSEELHERINRRVDEMFERGLVRETERLLVDGLERNKTAMQAIGYRQVVEHLRGERPLRETIELIKIKTRQFAKRQRTWLQGQFALKWLTPGLDKDISFLAEDIVRGR